MKTISIKGKDYIMVNERVKAFRNDERFKNWAIVSEIVELGVDHCTMKASILDVDGRTMSTGYAREVVAKSPINKFAFVENCETSAIGRALGILGIGIDTAICIGIDTAICSAEELNQKLSCESEQKDNALEKFKELVKGVQGADELLSEFETSPLEKRRELYAFVLNAKKGMNSDKS